jgi:hypothetical protein
MVRAALSEIVQASENSAVKILLLAVVASISLLVGGLVLSMLGVSEKPRSAVSAVWFSTR